ncbi:MAG TPA: hypothetical protein VHE81_00795 [Lacipirellulaceae bacterium]|nr:hypothetical protein [Lacipirellulaceae bacterium]
MKNLALGLAVITAGIVSVPAQATPTCPARQKLQQCWDTIEQSLAALAAAKSDPQLQFEKAAQESINQAQNKLLDEPIGTAVGLAQTVTQNFLTDYSLAGLGVGKGGAASALRGDLNLPLPGSDANNTQLRLGTIAKPDLAQPVANALAGATANTVDALREKLGPADDYSAQVSWTYRGSLFGLEFGRDLALYRDKLSALLAAAFPDAEQDSTDWNEGMQACASGTAPRPHWADLTPEQLEATEPFKKDAVHCSALLDQLPSMVGEQVDQLKAFATARDRAHLDRFADLVNNQPQLIVTFTREQLDPLVGNSSWAARISFETGWTNLDFFESGDGRSCFMNNSHDYASQSGYAGAGGGCLKQFRKYVEAHDSNLDSQDRLNAWVEYARLQDVHVSLPANALDLDIPGATRLSALAGFGRTLLSEGNGRSTRVDGTIRRDHFSGNSVRLDRTMYSLVLTQKLGLINVPFVLAYSDHAEFSGGSKGLTTSLGLGYDFGAPATPKLADIDLASRLRVLRSQ